MYCNNSVTYGTVLVAAPYAAALFLFLLLVFGRAASEALVAQNCIKINRSLPQGSLVLNSII